MDKDVRTALLLLDNRISKSKMEVLRSIKIPPKYDDSEIVSQINEMKGIVNSLEYNLKETKESKTRIQEYEKHLSTLIQYEEKNMEFHRQLLVFVGGLTSQIGGNNKDTYDKTKILIDQLNKLGDPIGAHVYYKPAKGIGSKIDQFNIAQKKDREDKK